MQTFDDAPRPDDDSGLLRALGRPEAIAIVVGNVIGSGIFLKPGGVAEQLHDFRLILLVWVVGGVLCMLGALTLAELAAMLPRAGGLYVYLREAYGPGVAFLWGWTDFLIVRPASIGALATAFVLSIPGLGQVHPLAPLVVAIALIALLAWINVRGVIWGGRVQNLTTLVKAGFLVLIAVLPFALLRFDFGYLTASSTAPATDADFGARFGIALLAVMWAYNGWHGVSIVGEEIKDPQRNLPVSLFAGVGILIALYLGVNLAYHVVLPVEEIADYGENASREVARRLLGPLGVSAIAAVIMVSTFGALNANFLIYPRVYFAMARDGIFLRSLARVHPRFHTPAVAIVVQAAIAASAVLITNYEVRYHIVADWLHGAGWISADALQNTTQQSVFELLTNLVILGGSIFYLLAVASVFILRRRRPDLPRPYRTVGYPWVPLAFVSGYIWFIWKIFDNWPAGAIVGLLLILTGLPVFAVWKARARRTPA